MRPKTRRKSQINLLTIDNNGEILNPDYDAYDQILFATEMSVPEYRSFLRTQRISQTLAEKQKAADRLADLERRQLKLKQRFRL